MSKELYKKNMKAFKEAYNDNVAQSVKNAESKIPMLATGDVDEWVNSLGDKWDVLVLHGIGHDGRCLTALAKKYPIKKKVIVIEYGFGELKHIMNEVDMTAVFGSSIEFIIGGTIKDLGRNAGRYVVNNLGKDYAFYSTPGYPKEDFEDILDTVYDEIRRHKVDYFTREKWQETWFLNFRENFPRYMNCPGVNSLYDKFKDVPAVIVSAGPSLEKNVGLLKGMKDKAIVISSGSGILLTLEQDMVPDLFVAFDPGEGAYNNIFQRLKRDDYPLVFGSTGYPKCEQEFEGPKFVFNVDVFTPWFEKQQGLSKGTLKSGATVSLVALFMAIKMGCNPIILVGQDLAYTDERQYAGDIHADRLGIDDETRPHLFEVDAWGGGKVLTSRAFYAMILQFNDIIRAANAAGIEVIDATEGGAKIEGAKEIALKDVELEKKGLTDAREIITSAVTNHKPPSEDEIDLAMEKFGQMNDDKMEYLELTKEVVFDCKDILAVGNMETGKAKYCEMKLNKIVESMRKIEESMLFKEFIYFISVHKTHTVRKGFNKRISALDGIARIKEAALGYVTMCRLMHDYMYFLEECFFKGIVADMKGADSNEALLENGRV